MNSDSTALAAPFGEETVFNYGDQTIVQLRSQPFMVEEDFGTVVTMPSDGIARLPVSPAATVALPFEEALAEEALAHHAVTHHAAEDDEPLARLERKLDLALRQIASLQQQLASLDTTLARVLTR